jgi:hypothetical protein
MKPHWQKPAPQLAMSCLSDFVLRYRRIRAVCIVFVINTWDASVADPIFFRLHAAC